MRSPVRDEDDLVMSLVEDALAHSQGEREAYLRQVCGTNSTLCNQVRNYIEWEERMDTFLLEPLVKLAEAPDEFEAGQVLINRFRLLRKVGEGGMGTVWEAMDGMLDRRVAIKFPKSGFGRHLPPEVRNARAISHANVCKIHDIHPARTDRGPLDFISMEFVEGETLSNRLRRGALGKQERMNIAQQLCGAVAEAHRDGVIHGDLKSSNILLSTWPGGGVRAVVMDFGLAHGTDTSEGSPLSGKLAGTPAYMAPELWKGVRPSVESDIYALGVVFWELLSGKGPDALGLTSTTLSWQERPAWKAPAGFGRWDSVLARCLEADPARRFHSVQEISRALGPPIARKWLAVGAGAAVLAIVSGVISYERAIAPAETVRLALLPFATGNLPAATVEKLRADTAKQLLLVRGNRHTGFTFVPLSKATHVLRPSVEPKGAELAVHVYLTDATSGVDLANWTEKYKPNELRYVPAALTGVVSETLHLTPVANAKVNARALSDYRAGLAALRRADGANEALRHFEAAVAGDHDSALTHAELGEARWLRYLLTTGAATRTALERTEKSAAEAKKRNPDLAEVHRITGLLEARRGQYTEAIAEYLRAIELEPANGDAYRRLGKAYESNNQPDRALGALLEAVRKDPQQYRNQQDLGNFYMKRGQYEEAIRHFREAAALASSEPALHQALSSAHLNAGQFSLAEDEIRRFIQLRETAVARHQLGLVLLYEGRESEAVSEILRAISMEPRKCLWWMNLGTAYRRSGKTAEAQRAYESALDLGERDLEENPSSGVNRAHVAYLCSQLGQAGRAESEIEQAIRQLPNDADVTFMAAWTYEALGRRDQSISALERSSKGVIADVSRWPDLAGLAKDSRFLQLLSSRSDKSRASGG